MTRPPLPLVLAAALALTAAPAGCKRAPAKTEPADAPPPAEARGHDAPGGRPLAAPAPLDADAGAAAVRQAALAAARPMTIPAAAGGIYRSVDGRVTVTVPPGALATDAAVRFWAVDTAALPETTGVVPGAAIDGDWGGARFRPGARVSFEAPVDPRVMAILRKAGRDGEDLGLMRDARGRETVRFTLTADPAGRPDAFTTSPAGAGALVQAARLPVAPDEGAADLPPDADPPAPPAPAGVATLAPNPADDPAIARWPGVAEGATHDRANQPVPEVAGRRVRGNAPATLVGAGAMASCAYYPCPDPPLPALADALRLNAAIAARRVPPPALRARLTGAAPGCD